MSNISYPNNPFSGGSMVAQVVEHSVQMSGVESGVIHKQQDKQAANALVV